MTARRSFLAVLFASLVVVAPTSGDDKDKKKEKDADKIKGTWYMVKGLVGDRTIVDPADPPDEWFFDADTITAKHLGKTYAKDRLNYVIDPSAKPRTIDIKFEGKPMFLGIYEFDGDRMRICYNMKKRPKKFASDDDSDPRNVSMEFEKK